MPLSKTPNALKRPVAQKPIDTQTKLLSQMSSLLILLRTELQPRQNPAMTFSHRGINPLLNDRATPLRELKRHPQSAEQAHLF